MRYPRHPNAYEKHAVPATSLSLERAIGFAGLPQMSEEIGMDKIAYFRTRASCMVHGATLNSYKTFFTVLSRNF